MSVLRSTTPLIALCITLSACSGGTGPAAKLPTILFTNALGIDYTAVALDQTNPGLDTVLFVPNGTQVCLRLSAASLNFLETVKLEAVDAAGYLIGTTSVRPAADSWTWDGVARNATVAPTC